MQKRLLALFFIAIDTRLLPAPVYKGEREYGKCGNNQYKERFVACGHRIISEMCRLTVTWLAQAGVDLAQLAARSKATFA